MIARNTSSSRPSGERVIIIDRGRIVANGTPQELKARSPEGRLEDVFRAITLPDTVKGN